MQCLLIWIFTIAVLFHYHHCYCEKYPPSHLKPRCLMLIEQYLSNISDPVYSVQRSYMWLMCLKQHKSTFYPVTAPDDLKMLTYCDVIWNLTSEYWLFYIFIKTKTQTHTWWNICKSLNMSIMHHFETKMCTFLLQSGESWDICLMHCRILRWVYYIDKE